MENFVFVGRHELLLSPNYPHIQCSSIMIPKTLPVLSITLAKIPHHTFTFFQAWFTYDFLRRFPKKMASSNAGNSPQPFIQLTCCFYQSAIFAFPHLHPTSPNPDNGVSNRVGIRGLLNKLETIDL